MKLKILFISVTFFLFYSSCSTTPEEKSPAEIVDLFLNQETQIGRAHV